MHIDFFLAPKCPSMFAYETEALMGRNLNTAKLPLGKKHLG